MEAAKTTPTPARTAKTRRAEHNALHARRLSARIWPPLLAFFVGLACWLIPASLQATPLNPAILWLVEDAGAVKKGLADVFLSILHGIGFGRLLIFLVIALLAAWATIFALSHALAYKESAVENITKSWLGLPAALLTAVVLVGTVFTAMKLQDSRGLEHFFLIFNLGVPLLLILIPFFVSLVVFDVGLLRTFGICAGTYLVIILCWMGFMRWGLTDSGKRQITETRRQWSTYGSNPRDLVYYLALRSKYPLNARIDSAEDFQREMNKLATRRRDLRQRLKNLDGTPEALQLLRLELRLYQERKQQLIAEAPRWKKKA